MAEELRYTFPVWIEYSGLPEQLNNDIRGGAWMVFKKLVELECTNNASPDTFEASVVDIAHWVGMEPRTVKSIIVRLRRKKLLVCFLPDSNKEPALFRINIPLPVPLTPRKIKKKFSSKFPPGKDFFRYVDKRVTETDGDDPELQELIDIYLNTIGLKINVFVIDELRLLKERFDLERLRDVFAMARDKRIKSVRWVARKLFKEEKETE